MQPGVSKTRVAYAGLLVLMACSSVYVAMSINNVSRTCTMAKSGPGTVNVTPSTEEFKQNMNNESDDRRSVVFYIYFERDDFYARTLSFFLNVGVRESDPVDYVFIVQGDKCSIDIPRYSNVQVVRRPNTCYDFGALGWTLEHLGGLSQLEKRYESVLVFNPSAVGPILPKYWPASVHWSEIFTSRLVDGVGLVGTSLVCVGPNEFGEYGPKIEGMAWAANFLVLRAAHERGVFRCFTNKLDVVRDGEYGLGRAALSAGANLDSLLLQYGPRDWRDKKNWDCNSHLHPSRHGTYGPGLSIHPLEVVFHKPIWRVDNRVISEVFPAETKAYMEWALQRVPPSNSSRLNVSHVAA